MDHVHGSVDRREGRRSMVHGGPGFITLRGSNLDRRFSIRRGSSPELAVSRLGARGQVGEPILGGPTDGGSTGEVGGGGATWEAGAVGGGASGVRERGRGKR